MLEKNLRIFEKYKNTLILVALFSVFVLTRFLNLGYSEYIPDETTVLTPIKNSELSLNFLMMQRKGPMQFLVAKMVNLVGINIYEEFWYRFPFFIFSVLGLYFLYKFLKNEEGQFVAVTSTLFLGLNGMLVAFGRVVQYQSLNLVFSFAGLYFLSLLKSNSNRIRNSLLGSLLLCLSVLSHWDAFFVFPIALYLVVRNLFLGETPVREKGKIIVALFVPVLLTLLPFFVNYAYTGLSDNGNISYLNSRIGYTFPTFEILKEKFVDYYARIELYNPFLYLYAVLILSFIGLIASKRSFVYFYWFAFILAIFIFFVTKPGTHIYNLFFPLSVLASFGAHYLYQLFKGFFSKFVILALTCLFIFLGYQDYLLLADIKVDYPWSKEKIIGYETRIYNQKALPNNIIGFPIKRGWKEAAEFLSSENSRNGLVLPYITNEESSIAEFYLDLNYGKAEEYYAIGVKRPLSFVNDYTFPNIKNKKTIKWVESNGEKTMRIYKVSINKAPGSDSSASPITDTN